MRAHEAAPQVDVADLEPDRLRGAQPAPVHHLEQRAVAEAIGSAPPTLSSSRFTSA